MELPLVKVLGQVHDDVAVYGSGGFTSLTDDQLANQLGGWAHGQGIPRVKMKVGEAWGSRPERDLERARIARTTIGEHVELFVDANGGYSTKQAVRMADDFEALGVTWFEEPVSSDHLSALAEIRAQTPIDIAAGEYGYDLFYFQAMCEAGAVDCLQADVSRCAGITEWLRVARSPRPMDFRSPVIAPSRFTFIRRARSTTFAISSTSPTTPESTAFSLMVSIDPVAGVLRPDLSRPGLGLELKHADAVPTRQLDSPIAREGLRIALGIPHTIATFHDPPLLRMLARMLMVSPINTAPKSHEMSAWRSAVRRIAFDPRSVSET